MSIDTSCGVRLGRCGFVAFLVIGVAATLGVAAEPRAVDQVQPKPIGTVRTSIGAALEWLVEHQSADGGWNFDHRGGKCAGRCRHPGALADARIAATGLALLPFLGAGQTHKEGEFKPVVQKGIDFLRSKMKVQEGEIGDLTEPGGTMYSHGIAAIVLSEAYAMSQDKELRKPAQQALNFIVATQDPKGGGWRYAPKQPGDTSILGWQLMALKSGRLAKLDVPPATIRLAARFLDSVQAEEGSQYGYTGPATDRYATTAIGLLCRKFTGWESDRPAVKAGVKFIGKRGPSPTNMYYNYFAMQLMYCQLGDDWGEWNKAHFERIPFGLLHEAEGHEGVSVFFDGDDPGAKAGGRLYCTVMATMLRQIYYRHLPIYGKAAFRDDFNLEQDK